MDLSDERWPGLKGGYRLPYDPRAALRALKIDQDADAAWSELWEELHHQDDVDIASYAAMPLIADLAEAGKTGAWNAWALAVTIELARANTRNPPIPDWLAPGYEDAWRRLGAAAVAALPQAQDPLVVRSLLAVIAIHKRLPVLGKLAADFSEEELREILGGAFAG